MKRLITVVLLVLCCSTAQAMTATLNNVQVQGDDLVLSFTLINGEYSHAATVRMTSVELAAITTWAQLWAMVQPRLLEEATKYQSLDTKADLLKSKIGVAVTL